MCFAAERLPWLKLLVVLALAGTFSISPICLAKSLDGSLSVGTGKQMEHHGDSEELLAFPEHVSLGKLFKVHVQPNGWDIVVEPHPFASAQGVVHVPAGTSIRLKLSFDGVVHIAELDKVNPKTIVSIDARGLDNLNDDALVQVGNLTNLLDFTLGETDISDKGIAHLTRLKKLTKLGLSRALLTSRSLAYLKNFSALHVLNLSYNRLQGGSLTDLLALEHLEYLELKQCGIDDNALSHIGKQSKLRHINLAMNDKITDLSIPPLKKLTHLQELDVEGTKISCSGLLKLKGSPLLMLSCDLKNGSPEAGAELRKAFPGCVIDGDHTSNRHYTPDLFTPMK